MMTITFYAIYVIFSLAFTFWVGTNLYRSGRIFLMDSFQQDERKADAVNQLLLVGFYLVNIGLVSLFLSVGQKPTTVIETFELLAHKIGIVLLVLGGMHFFNMRNISQMRAKALSRLESKLSHQSQQGE